MNLKEKDITLLQEKGITPQQLEDQLHSLATGFPYLKIESPATIGNGITNPDDALIELSLKAWQEYIDKGGKPMKMVPASGAASRMFKDIFAFIDGSHDKPNTDFMKAFFDNITKFAFFPRLNWVCLNLYSQSVLSLIREKKYKDIARALVGKEGMNYGFLPKALLQFHKVTGTSRTPLEEHLAEAAQYAADKKGKASVHFTLSPDHLPLAEMKVEESAGVLQNEYDVEFEVSYSCQKPSTDTVAANLDGTPYREEGSLFFRPGGHGALIENLNDLDGDVVFIKNIDNVVPDELRESTVRYKKALAGMLVAARQKAHEYCRLIKDKKYDSAALDGMLFFLRDMFHITHDNADNMTDSEKADYIFGKLNRPIRVCGMVRNEGEPGGGPFLTYSADGTVSPQILESTQINPDDKKALKMLKESTHFNPVDLVCSIKDYEGNKFNLLEFVDKSTGFISQKSRQGVEIKALELPGLWNGAMSDWNSIFVEVPADTFNPVKTVNDLLRPAHQPKN